MCDVCLLLLFVAVSCFFGTWGIVERDSGTQLLLWKAGNVLLLSREVSACAKLVGNLSETIDIIMIEMRQKLR